MELNNLTPALIAVLTASFMLGWGVAKVLKNNKEKLLLRRIKAYKEITDDLMDHIQDLELKIFKNKSPFEELEDAMQELSTEINKELNKPVAKKSTKKVVKKVVKKVK